MLHICIQVIADMKVIYCLLTIVYPFFHVSNLLNFIRNGSIIASFSVTYRAIDSLQIVILQEQIAGGTLGNVSAELLNIASSYGKKS